MFVKSLILGFISILMAVVLVLVGMPLLVQMGVFSDTSFAPAHANSSHATQASRTSEGWLGRLLPQKDKTKTASKSTSQSSDKARKTSQARTRVNTVMNEVEDMQKAELRDQAYYEVVEYALVHGLFAEALKAHDSIEQEELGYTARAQIAVAYAKKGRSEKAFNMIDEVEDPQLRDFMRLQVIEALISTDSDIENR
ncbi:MAG: hypothetical protein ACPGVT_02330 [Maricaulaceae bacterium]